MEICQIFIDCILCGRDDVHVTWGNTASATAIILPSHNDQDKYCKLTNFFVEIHGPYTVLQNICNILCCNCKETKIYEKFYNVPHYWRWYATNATCSQTQISKRKLQCSILFFKKIKKFVTLFNNVRFYIFLYLLASVDSPMKKSYFLKEIITLGETGFFFPLSWLIWIDGQNLCVYTSYE